MMGHMANGDTSPGQGAQLVQFAPMLEGILKRLVPVFDQPIIRMPYLLPLSTSKVIPAGASNVPLVQSDFSLSLEWPFEIEQVVFSQDPSHTFRDWRVAFSDQVFNQPWQKAPVMVATLVDANTGAWKRTFPWTMRPKGGAINVFVDNLDTVNPITIDLNFIGSLMIPR